MNRGPRVPKNVQYFVTALACLASAKTMALAQQNLPGGYEVTETNVASPTVAAENVGPVRMARFCLIQGKVNCRPSTKVDWAPASLNQPIRQGEQIFVPANSRAEIAFDDGSIARLGGGAFVTMQTLYSDDQGEFTEVKLNDGLATWRLKNKLSVYQIDTPFCSVKASGPARFRVGARKTCEVANRVGNCTVEDQNGHTDVAPGQFVELGSATDALHTVPLPPDDSWEQWNEQRDRVYDTGSPISQKYLPPDVALAAPDLDSYGSWRDVPQYGHIWVPRVTEAGWRPYHNGHWVWVDPFGWTWVGQEAWGWAPYHYGTWVHSSYGWGWNPGPAQQCWSPAVVSFSSYNGSVAWAPLCPEEVHYPSRLAIGFSGGDWSVLFSIGGCGAYYPGRNHICEERAWNNTYINRVTYVTNYNGYGGRPFYASNNNSYLRAGAWTPRNARFGGGSIVTANGFAGAGRYNFVAQNNLNAFQRGQAIGIPGRGGAPAVGPSHIRPTLASLTPGRSFNHVAPAAALASRPLFRSALAPRVASSAPNFSNRLVTRAPGQVKGAGRPGIGIPNGPGAAHLANRPNVPGATGVRPNTSHLQSANRPGAPINRTAPASVQAARKTLGVGNNRQGVTSTPGRTNTFQHTTATNPHTAQINHGANPRVTTNRTPNVVKRNPVQTQAHSVANAHRPSSFQGTTTNRSPVNAHRTTATRTNTVSTPHVAPSRPNNQPVRIARQPSPSVQTHRNDASFQRGSFSAPVRQERPVQAPRSVSPPQNNAPRQQPAPRQQSAPQRSEPPAGGGGNRPTGGGRNPRDR